MNEVTLALLMIFVVLPIIGLLWIGWAMMWWNIWQRLMNHWRTRYLRRKDW